MLYRIDIQHFLTHMIDYFSFDELTSAQYLIISAAVMNQHKQKNVVKCPDLYPTTEIVKTYAETGDKKLMEKMFMELLKPEKGSDWENNVIYRFILDPLDHHFNIIIICDEKENDFIDVIAKYLKKSFSIETINLNELFIKGKLGPITIDREKIRNKTVDVRINALKEEQKRFSATRDGRLHLISLMTTKEKKKKLKELGVNLEFEDKKNYEKLLVEVWADELEDEEGG